MLTILVSPENDYSDLYPLTPSRTGSKTSFHNDNKQIYNNLQQAQLEHFNRDIFCILYYQQALASTHHYWT